MSPRAIRRALGLSLVVLMLTGGLVGCSPGTPAGVPAATSPASAGAASGDAVFAEAFAEQRSGLLVQGRGTVERLLADDTDGDRHQRFVVRLASGQTLLIVHNLDVAPRVEELQVGGPVAFKGEYEWNGQGGLVHWTHHDPDGSHAPGWIEFRGKKYQ
jgi:hypothetical protein